MRKNYTNIIKNEYCDPSKRMDFILFFEVANGNPNGDPDAGNLPRLDPTDNHGIITDVSTKRKIRDYFDAALGRPIFIQNKTALNSLILETARNIANNTEEDAKDRKLAQGFFGEIRSGDLESRDNKAKKRAEDFLKLIPAPTSDETVNQTDGESEVTFRDFLINLSSDYLLFESGDLTRVTYCGDSKKEGDILAELESESTIPPAFAESFKKLVKLLSQAKGDPSRETKELVKQRMCRNFDDIRLFGAVLTAGTNAGQIRGPMQLTFGRSIDPIVPIEASITRKAITKASDFLKKQTEMGRKPFIPWAAYEQNGFYNAPLGADPAKGGTGVTREDLARFWEAIANMFPEAKSAANGRMNVCELLVFVHNDESGRGCAPFHKLREKVSLVEKEGVDEFTKGFSDRYKDIEIRDEDKINEAGIKVYRPLKDLWPDLG